MLFRRGAYGQSGTIYTVDLDQIFTKYVLSDRGPDQLP